MKILADKTIPFIESFFNDLGDIELIDSIEFTPNRVSDADVLLVRSITRVDEGLLCGSNVKFIATPTSGHDHIDTEYLDEKQVHFAHAPGCNARSVAEYVISSLCVISELKDIKLQGKTAGIIGYGHVGTIVAAMMSILGIECLIYDPPLQKSGAHIRFSTFEDIQSADIITLHVPLVCNGDYPTRYMIDESFLEKLSSDLILINTSRGRVIDEHSLINFVSRNPESTLILDVWENEPDINLSMLAKTVISTPHIAGYSLDGRLKGTQMICRQFCDYFDKYYKGPDSGDLPGRLNNRIPISEFENETEAIQMAILASYDVRSDSACLRQLLAVEEDITGDTFMELRNNYPIRREFSAMTVEFHDNTSGILKEKLSKLGFTVT